MARTLYGCFGPDYNDAILLMGASVTGMTIVSTTTAGASPPRALRWWKVDSSASGVKNFMQNPGVPAALTFMWDCIILRVEGSLGASTSDPFVRIAVDGGDSYIQIWWVRTNADQWKIRATKTSSNTLIADGTTTTLDHDVSYEVRWQLDGTDIKVWVNRILEIDTAYTDTIDADGVTSAVAVSTSGVEHYLCQWGRFGSNSESDLPDSDVTVDLLVENAQGPDDTYRDQADGTSGDADENDVALDGSLDVDQTIHWLGHTTEAGAQNVELTTVTPANTVEGALQRTISRANVSSKTVAWDSQLLDSEGTPNTVEVAGTNLGNTTFTLQTALFDTPPGGGDWDDFTLADLRAGVQHPSGNGANDEHAALVVELCSVATDADAPAGDTETAGEAFHSGALMSSNIGIF